MTKLGKVRRIPGLTLRQVTRVQTPARRPRGRLEGRGTWRGCGAAGAGAWTEDETLTASSSLATKQPQRDNNQQKQRVDGEERRKENEGEEEDKVNMELWMKKMLCSA